MLCVLLLSGCGSNDDVKTGDEAAVKNAEEKPSSQDAPAEDYEKQLRADLDDAVTLLEKGDLAQFFERYAPIEQLLRIRKESSIKELVAQNQEEMQEGLKELISRLKAVKGGKIEFLDEDKSQASIKPKTGEEEPDDLTAPDFALSDPAEQKTPAYEGFQGDVKEAIKQAAQVLEAGDHKKFVENFFPESELARATSEEGLETLAVRLKEHPEMAGKMVADLKALASLTPEMNAENTTATFELNAQTPPARTIRFEKQGGTWRLADSAKEVRTEMLKQSKQMLKPLKTQEPEEGVIEWIRIRDHWRISDIR
jgi:hypothetical protein